MSRLLALSALATMSVSAGAQTPPPGTRQVKIDVSPAGETVLKKYLGVRDPAIGPILDQLRAVSQQIAGMANTPKLDLVRLRALMRRQESLQAAVQRRGNDRTLAMLSELSEADRVKFLRSFRAAQAGSGPSAGK